MLLRSGRTFSSSLLPALPLEVLHLIAELGSFETRAGLVRCNKWLHNTCNPLLYREIRIRTSHQLLKLLRTPKAMKSLESTKTMFIDHVLFFSKEWRDVDGVLQLVECLDTVLRATVSLRRLQVLRCERSTALDSRSPYPVSQVFSQILPNLASNSALLPKLEVLVNVPRLDGWAKCCRGRPITYSSLLRDYRLLIDIFPALKRSRLQCNPDRDLSASDVGWFVQATTDTPSRLKVTNLQLCMRSADAFMHNTPSPIHDPLGWVQSMLLAAGCVNLETLFVHFELEPPHQSASAQYLALVELQRILPNLTQARFFPNIFWYRYPTGGTRARPPHLAKIDWTPMPGQASPEVLTWWLETLGHHVSRTHDYEELTRTVVQLQDGMRAWWSEVCIPGKDQLHAELLARTR